MKNTVKPSAVWIVECVAALMVAAFWLNSSIAQLNYITADRSVSAVATVCETSSEDASTKALGPFSAMVEASEEDGMEFCQGFANSGAEQVSDLAPLQIVATGSSGATYALGAGQASGRSALTTTFQIAAPTPYQLSGQINGGIIPGFDLPGEAVVSLAFDGGPVIHEITQVSQFVPVMFDFSGVLAPGTYSFEADAPSSVFTDGGASASFDVAFTAVPEPSSVLITISMLVFLVGTRRTIRNSFRNPLTLAQTMLHFVATARPARALLRPPVVRLR
jgi:hypothetical protein